MRVNATAACWSVLGAMLGGCAPSSLGYNSDKANVLDTGAAAISEPDDSGTDSSDPSTTPSDTSTTSSTTSETTGTSTGTTGTSTGTTGTTGTGTGPTKFVPGPAGTYRGTIRIDYELVLPLVGGSERCSGDMELTWEPDVSNALSGDLLSCDWPLLSIWANLTMGDVSGTFDGSVVDGLVSGNTQGGDGNFWAWDDAWSAIFHGDTIVGGFSGRNLLVDNYSATFELNYSGS